MMGQEDHKRKQIAFLRISRRRTSKVQRNKNGNEKNLLPSLTFHLSFGVFVMTLVQNDLIKSASDFFSMYMQK